jgi:hypothetical protein
MKTGFHLTWFLLGKEVMVKGKGKCDPCQQQQQQQQQKISKSM